MQALFQRVFLIFVIACGVALAQPNAKALVGSWIQNGDQNVVWTFRGDGSGFLEHGKPHATARFNWELQGNNLKVTTAGIQTTYTVTAADASSLVLRSDRGSTVYNLRRRP